MLSHSGIKDRYYDLHTVLIVQLKTAKGIYGTKGYSMILESSKPDQLLPFLGHSSCLTWNQR